MNNIFKTDDLAIASFLLAKGAHIIEVTQDRPRHCVFIFQDSTLCEELKREYLNNGVASARELFARREELMGEMRNGDRNYGQYNK
jgi:hypothetical protein